MINISNVTLLQEIRAIHALSELNIKLCVDEPNEMKFSLLKQYFDMEYSISLNEGLDLSRILKIDHSIPYTSIFSVTKPLIFPKAITSHLKEEWPRKRKIEFLFAGLITPEREFIIEKWLRKNFNKPYSLRSESIFYKIKKRFHLKLIPKKPLVRRFGKLFVSSSNRGRIFPVKSWDKDYYELLLRSKFILCPSGVYTWTYRFFEAILCGSIPIVEESSPIYEGFKYYTLSHDTHIIKWTKETAEYNFNLCIDRIIFSEDDKNEIKSMLNSKTFRSGNSL